MKNAATILISLAVALTSIPLLAEIDRSFSKTDEQIDKFYGTNSNRNSTAQYDALAKIEVRMDKIDDFTRDSNIEFFGESLRKLPRKNIFQVYRRIEAYDKVQQILLSIPGHAEFYAKPIWEDYHAFRDPSHSKHSGSSSRFSRTMHLGTETLKHLPSPETIKVLGAMLREEWEIERGPEDAGMTFPSAMAHQATWTLADLPLRNKPSPPFERYQVKEHLPAWQKWYEKVKSGEIPFSFVGQPVEYRFQADGNVVSTPVEIPEAELKQIDNAAREQKRPEDEIVEKAGKDTEPPSPGSPFPWLWVSVLVLSLVVFVGFFKIRRS